MSWVIYLFGGGVVFFPAVGLVLAGLAALRCCRRRVWRDFASLCVVIGLLLVGVSATPLPYWLYVIAFAVTSLWLVSERYKLGWLLARRKLLRVMVVVLMFELPLLPFCNEYGRVQRRLASRYGVVLIPKRVFAGVLTEEGATLDSVHLDRQGHERMAEIVWSVIWPAYRE